MLEAKHRLPANITARLGVIIDATAPGVYFLSVRTSFLRGLVMSRSTPFFPFGSSDVKSPRRGLPPRAEEKKPGRFPFGPLLTACCLFFFAASVAAAGERGNVPAELDNALSGMLSAVSPHTPPNQTYMNVVLAFVAACDKADDKVHPADRPEGSGIFRHTTLRVPLRTVMNYLVNPAVPGEAVNPSSVRVNDWNPQSEVLTKAETFRNTPLPPAAPVVLRGTEFEETTPDVSSGGYYSYTLHRLFVLTAYEGRAALFSVSRMPGRSAVGRKGAIVGKDEDWTYVYTPTKGTNLSLVGWADTYLYGSSSVTVFLETAPGSKTTEMYIFKWAKAGWSGMNVIKPSHLRDGVDRFLGSLHTVLESPRSPSPEAIGAYKAELEASDDAALRERLKSFARDLTTRSQKDSLLSQKDFQAVLGGQGYAASLTRRQMISELLKLYLRKQLGKPVPAGV